jgi:cation/acetate symporter
LKKNINPNISEKGELWAARISIAVAVVAAGLAGLNPPGFVAEVVALAFGLAASSFFPAIILGIFDKKMNKEGAIAGMLTGIIFTALYILYFKPQLGGIGLPEDYLFGISPEGIGTIGMIINFIVSLIVSRLTKPTPEKIKALVESIRYPK